MATQSQFIANRLNTQKSTSTRSLSMSLGTPADCFMQNKPNLLDAQMNISKVSTKDYGNFRLYGRRENKANSKPIYPYRRGNKANFNAYQTQLVAASCPVEASAKTEASGEAESCPPPADSKGAPMLLCGALKSCLSRYLVQILCLGDFVAMKTLCSLSALWLNQSTAGKNSLRQGIIILALGPEIQQLVATARLFTKKAKSALMVP